jgi:hypothetical protein
VKLSDVAGMVARGEAVAADDVRAGTVHADATLDGAVVVDELSAPASDTGTADRAADGDAVGAR